MCCSNSSVAVAGTLGHRLHLPHSVAAISALLAVLNRVSQMFGMYVLTPKTDRSTLYLSTYVLKYDL